MSDAHTTKNELLDAAATPPSRADEVTLRPRTLDDFVGQHRVRDQLTVLLQSASIRGAAPDHVLFSGPPGLGKTSLAGIVAAECDAMLRTTSGPALERPGDLAAILTNIEEGDVLFVDEIHRLPKTVEEVLYPALEDFQLDIMVGKGPAARSLRIELPRFTLVGATTRRGLVSAPLRDRFGFQATLEFYPPEELAQIIERSATILGITIDAKGAHEIATRSRGTPRIANRLLHRVRDHAVVTGSDSITADIASAALDVFEVDHAGLDRLDRRVLTAIVQQFDGGPVGLHTLATSLGEEQDTLADAVEPYLLQQGFIQRTPRGRTATARGMAHIGIEPRVIRAGAAEQAALPVDQ